MITEADTARLAPGVLLRHDRTRDQWTLLDPERVLVLDELALEVVRACVQSGSTVGTGIGRLAADFQASRTEISGDVLELLQDMRERGFVAAGSSAASPASKDVDTARATQQPEQENQTKLQNKRPKA
ncbi:MAG TPA: pyrroloquinoline quinone biosynthesis peptide chaperone PqqD [Azospirillum sp.]|nr:pyrroloquinoline quinone biosynthesis peptide chaperone PqqD [Azospirillum sp.]